MKITNLTPDSATLAELGSRLGQVRKQQGFSQARLAQEAGIGVATLRRIEAGKDGQLGSWLKLLKVLGMASSIDSLLPENFRSPMAQIKAEKSRAYSKAPSGQVWGEGDT